MAYVGPSQANIDPALQQPHPPLPNGLPNSALPTQAQHLAPHGKSGHNGAPLLPPPQQPHGGAAHPPPTPNYHHAAKDSPTADSPTGTGNPNDPNDFKRPRACEACRQLKVKCEMDDTTVPCKRCAKANRQCTVTAPSRKRQKKTDSRVAELEKKIDSLTASLAARGGDPDDITHAAAAGHPTAAPLLPQSHHSGLPLPPPAPPTQLPAPGQYSSHWPGAGLPPPPPPLAVLSHGTKRPSGEREGEYFIHESQRPVSGAPYPPPVSQPRLSANSYTGQGPKAPPEDPALIFDPISQGALDPPTVKRCWDRYNTEMCRHVPSVVFPAGSRWEDLRKTKPILFLAVVAVASGTIRPEVQPRLLNETTRVFGDRIVHRGEKSLELVQAILCIATFYQPPDKYEELNFNQLIHIAAVMALDLGLGKRFRKGNVALWRTYTEQKRVMADPNSAEARRTWLACYFMCCNSAMSLRRPLLIRWSPYADECVGILTSAADAAPSDKWLCQLARGQHIAEDIGHEFSMDDPASQLSLTDHKTQYHLKAFERRLSEWYESATPEMQNRASLKHIYGVVNLYMHEIAMHRNHNIDDFKPPFHATPIEGPPDPDFITPTHIESLTTCMNSVHTVLDSFLSMDIPALRSLPTLFFVRNSYAAVALIKMYTAVSAKGSKFGRILSTEDLKVDQYLDRMIAKLSATAEGGLCKVAQKFSVIFNMLKQWHIRRTDPDQQDGNRSRPASRNKALSNTTQVPDRPATDMLGSKADAPSHHRHPAHPSASLSPERPNSGFMPVPAPQDPNGIAWGNHHVPSQQPRNGLHMLSDAAISPVQGQPQQPQQLPQLPAPGNQWAPPPSVTSHNPAPAAQMQTLPSMNPDMDPNLIYAGAPGIDGLNVSSMEAIDLMAYGFGDEFMAMGFGMEQGGWAF